MTLSQKRIKQQQRRPVYHDSLGPPTNAEVDIHELIVSRAKLEGELDDEYALPRNPSRVLAHLFGQYRLRKTTKSIEIAVAAQANQVQRTLDEMVPDFIKDFRILFEKEASDRFPPRRSWDHPIDLKPLEPGKKPYNTNFGKRYFLTATEKVELRKYLDENLAKGFIRPSKSPMASPFFFTAKKDGKLRPVQDY